MAGTRASFMNSFGMTRAKEACRTAGRLEKVFAPAGHVFREVHLRNALGEDDSAECVIDRVAATFCGRRGVTAARMRAVLGSREDSSLVVIIVGASVGGICWV